jgi:hypothetical protein
MGEPGFSPSTGVPYAAQGNGSFFEKNVVSFRKGIISFG